MINDNTAALQLAAQAARAGTLLQTTDWNTKKTRTTPRWRRYGLMFSDDDSLYAHPDTPRTTRT